jgi:hypothetical protein
MKTTIKVVRGDITATIELDQSTTIAYNIVERESDAPEWVFDSLMKRAKEYLRDRFLEDEILSDFNYMEDVGLFVKYLSENRKQNRIEIDCFGSLHLDTDITLNIVFSDYKFSWERIKFIEMRKQGQMELG